MARHRRGSWWRRFGHRLTRAWEEFKLEGAFQKLDLPSEPLPGPPPVPPGSPPPTRESGDGGGYDDLERRVLARLHSWRLGKTRDRTDDWDNSADWAKVEENVHGMHELDLRQILSMTREEFRAQAERYAPFWYH